MSGRPHIVCVDDEQAVLNQLSAQLSRRFGATHFVECAESAEEALGLIGEVFTNGDRVELVLCDQVMPGMKGDHFLEAVHESHPEIMKVLLTGQAGLDSAIYAINHASLDRYIEKPWAPEDLNLSIQSLLTQYQLRRDLDQHRTRLEKRGRDLQGLHHVGRELASSVQADRVLALTVEAARNVSGATVAAAVAVVAAGESPRWAGLPASGMLDTAERRAIEACLGRLRAARSVEGPAPCPAGFVALPLHQSDLLFGWLFAPEKSAADRDAGDLFAILADQAAASLNRIRLLEERVASERSSAIGHMISALAHDLRNPMTAIKGYAGMFEEFEMPREKQRECGRLIVEESDRMSAMIEEILDFSRGERTPLKLAPVTVADLSMKVHRLVEPAFRAKGVLLKAELAYTGPVIVDGDKLRRALLNIASNALDATDPGGCLTLSSAVFPGGVEIALQDTGRGIPEELQPRVFEPFFTHGKARGIGLGMAIARRIVEEHGGTIELESQPGRGTRFTLRLPQARPAGAA